MKKLLSLLLLIFWVSVINAATYYISPTGNDATGNGSAAAPWKTLKKATGSVTTPGNIIHVNAGVYTETQTSNLAPGVSIEGDGATSVLRATFSTIYQMIINCYSVAGTNGNQHISNIKMDGQGSTSWAIQIQGRSNFKIYDCEIVNFKQRGIVWGGRSDNGDGPPTIYATGNEFYNNIVTNCASFDGTYGYGCLNIGGQDGMLIYNNTITTTGNMPGWPIKLWNDGYVKGVKIYNNILKRPPYPYQYNGINNYFDFCIELFHQWGIEIYNNIIEGSIDLNWQLKGNYAYSAYIHDNIIGRSSQAAFCETGIWLEFESEYVRIENNTYKSLSQPIMFSLRPGNYMNNIIIKNNLAYSIGKTDGSKQGTAIGIIVNDDSQNYSAKDWDLSNNTFLSMAGNNKPWFGVVLPSGNSATNIKFDNNIVTGFETGVSVLRASKVNGLTSKNNIFYGNGNNNLIQFQNGSPVNFVTSGIINSNPNLNAEYKPTGPPAKNAGTNGTDIGFTGGGAAPPPQPCSFVYTEWTACNASGFQYRTVISSSPANCVGEPVLMQTCTPPPPVPTYLTVVATNPKNVNDFVSSTTKVSFTFSGSLDKSTVNTNNISLKKDGVDQAFTVSVVGSKIYITPKRVYTFNRIYTITLSTNIKDNEGKSLQQPYSIEVSREQNIFLKQKQ